MKHLSHLLLAFLSVISCSFTLHAQTGTWEAVASFTFPPQKVIDTGSKVYYLSGNALFSYDKKADESHAYTSSNLLNAPSATGIYYNTEGKYLLIAYSTGNIDLLYDDGHLVNMSDISDSSIDPPLTINDVCFSGDRIYVATNLGLVEFNGTRHEVVQSGIYSTPVNAVTVIDGNVVISADGMLLFAPCGSRFPSLSQFTSLGACTPLTSILPLSGTDILAITTDKHNTLRRLSLDFNTPAITSQNTIAAHTPGFDLSQAEDGKFYYVADGNLYSVNPQNPSETLLAQLPDTFAGCRIGTADGAEAIWSLTRDGLACHGFGSDGSVTLISDRYRPAEFSVREICYLVPSPQADRLFVTNNGTTTYRFDKPGTAGFNKPFTASCIDLISGETSDVTPYPVDAVIYRAKEAQNSVGKYLVGPTSIAFDPDDKDVFYASSSVDGIYKMRAGEREGVYGLDHTPLEKIDERAIAYRVSTDQFGNLWLFTTTDASTARPLFILPADKRRLDPQQIQASDWFTPDTRSVGYTGGQDVQIVHCKRSNITFVADHNTSNLLFVYDNRGTQSLTDDRMARVTRITDQDGNTFTPNYTSALCEDRDGAVWVGTDQGIYIIPNPSSAVTDNLTVRRAKVPKNDGSNTAEYLLGTDLIYSISTDAANRKWIATKASGLFLVSADGSEILRQFTDENSPLPSKDIYSVYADPNSSTVYVGTAEGLFTYTSDASPAMDSFSDIVVYPNPVAPDYSGPIYIKGLMDDSLVKIADSAGNVVHQGRSQGGMFSWDGCNGAGRPVPSGVYFVFASQGSDSGNKGGTAKFMIVR